VISNPNKDQKFTTIQYCVG